jgi:hypothetical protein
MLSLILGGLVLGGVFTGPEEDSIVRGAAGPSRHDALAGALRLERPACPVPSRVAGSLQLVPRAR